MSGSLQGASWLLPPALRQLNVLYVLWIFAVCVFQMALISHLPSAGLCVESSSLLCLLCLRWSWNSIPAIRQSFRDSSYKSSREQLEDAVLLHTSGWVVGREWTFSLANLWLQQWQSKIQLPYVWSDQTPCIHFEVKLETLRSLFYNTEE